MTPEEESHTTGHFDPRAKFLATALLAVQITVFGSVQNLVICLVIILAAAMGNGMSPLSLALQTRRVFWFILFIVGTNTFTQDGTVVFEAGGFVGTLEGLKTGALLSAKLVLLFWCALVFVHSTPPEAIIEGIEASLSPLRKRLGPLIMLITITCNFIPSLVQLAQRIRLGYLARGIDIESGFLRRLRHLSAAQVPLFRRAFRLSDQLALAMEARCYEPSRPRTMYASLKFRARDWALMTGAATLFTALAIFGS